MTMHNPCINREKMDAQCNMLNNQLGERGLAEYIKESQEEALSKTDKTGLLKTKEIS